MILASSKWRYLPLNMLKSSGQPCPFTMKTNLVPNVKSKKVEKLWKEGPIFMVMEEETTNKKLGRTSVLLTKEEKYIPDRRGKDMAR